MSDVPKGETVSPDTVNKHNEREIISYEASTDSPRRKAKVATAIKS